MNRQKLWSHESLLRLALVLPSKHLLIFPPTKTFVSFAEQLWHYFFIYFYSYSNILKLREMKSAFCLKDRLLVQVGIISL